MPQQGPRAAVGHQGSGGAVLTAVRRLSYAGVGVIVGGMIVAAGTRVTWVTATVSSEPVTAPGLPRVGLGGGRFPYDGGDVGAGYLFGLGLILALVPLVWLVTGPRGRVAVSLAGIAVAIGAGVGVATVRGDLVARAERLVRAEEAARDAEIRIARGPGAGVTAAGAAVAGLAASAGAVVGRGIPRLGMPERPGGDDR